MKIENISDDEILKLDNQLCFALYVSSKEIIKKYKPLLEPLNLTYTAYITLLVLWEQENITVKELGKRLFLDSGTLTPLLKRMESKGFLTRTRSSDDERNVRIGLTERGKQLKQRATHIPRELICSSNFDIGSAGELLKLLHSNFPSQD